VQGGHRKLIAPFVFWNTGVALDPAEFRLMLLAQLQQFLPQVNVLCALLVVEPPILLFPRHGPALHDRVHQILRIAVNGGG